MSDWIKDRLPTAEDAHSDGDVWITTVDGLVIRLHWGYVKEGTAWAHIYKPEPFTGWTVKWKKSSLGNESYWTLYYNDTYKDTIHCLDYSQGEAAQRIADVYNEVLP
jgi:hypothetical protein